MKPYKYKQGFLRAIVSIAVALIVLKYAFKVDVFELADHPKVAPYMSKLAAWTEAFWMEYVYPWARVVLEYAADAWEFVWKWIRIGMERLKEFAGDAYPEFLRPW